MIPILFDSTETTFTSNGIGRLADCTRCLVTEERNGQYECEFDYPITGRHYSDIEEGRIVFCTHDDLKVPQPFVIYRRTAPIDGLVTFNARHLSYKLSTVIVNPFSAANISDALAGLSTNSINTNPFTFSTQRSTIAPFAVTAPASVRSLLGGVEGSLLDVYGGEWEFDKWTVTLHAHRGHDSGVSIRYGKNLSDLQQVVDASGLYNAVVPYWEQEVDGQTVLVMLPERIVAATGVTDPVPVVMDLSMEFAEQPTEAQLRAYAQDYLAIHEPWMPSENLTVDFVHLKDTTDYASVANLQRVNLCDTVDVYYPALGVTAHNIEVIKTVYNVLSERYDSIELGQPQTTFGQALQADLTKQVEQAQSAMQTIMDAAIQQATDLIAGGRGGHLVIGRNADGEPEELLIMDTDSILTATNIIRMNLSGIGFSTDGGTTYSTAWTINGAFVADFITSGTLRTILIEGPNGTGWNLVTGRFTNYDESTVTAQVETSSGVYTPVTYDIKHTLAIDDGLMQLTGEVDNSGEDIELFALGLNGEGMDYEYYGAADQNVDKSYPYTGLNLSGSRINGAAGTVLDSWNSEAVTYIPKAVMTPDYIELGRADDMLDSNDDPVTNEPPNRNMLHLGAGWSNYKDSIYLQQNYIVDSWWSGQVEYHNRYVSYKRRVSWELNPYDSTYYAAWYGVGFFIDSKREVRLTLPVSRPINYQSISRVEGSFYLLRMWQNGSVIYTSGDDVGTRCVMYSNYAEKEPLPVSRIYSKGENDITIGIRREDDKDAPWTSGGTDRAPVCIELRAITVSFY